MKNEGEKRIPRFTINNLKKSYRETRGADEDAGTERRGLTRSTQKKTVLNIKQLELYSGKFIAIMGVSGSGKSTFLNMVGKLDSPDKEEKDTIVYHDNDQDIPYAEIENDHLFRKSHFGYVFQHCYELKYFSTQDNVALPLAVRGARKDDRRAIAKTLMNDLGLKKEAFKPAKDLSGGQISRLSILRGIAHNPDVVFADEPTSSLDPKTGLMVMELLETWRQSGTSSNGERTVVMVTHNLDHAFKYADQIVILNNGEVVFNETRENKDWSNERDRISSLMQVERPETKKIIENQVDFGRPLFQWLNRQLFAWGFAWKDLFPNLTIKGLAPVFLGVLSLWFLLLIGFFFSDLKIIGDLNNKLLLQNPFLKKIDVSETGEKGFTRRLMSEIGELSKNDLSQYLSRRIAETESAMNRLNEQGNTRMAEAKMNEVDDLKTYLELLNNTESVKNVAAVYPYSYTDAHFRMKSGLDAPSRYDGRTLVNWKDPMLTKLTYLTKKPEFKTWNEAGLIVGEDLARNLGYDIKEIEYLEYKYSKLNTVVKIPVLAVVRGLPEGTEYLIPRSLQKKLLGECYSDTQQFLSVRVGPIPESFALTEWESIAASERMEIFKENLYRNDVEQQWIRWQVWNEAESMPLKNWKYFLKPILEQGMTVEQLEKFTPPCSEFTLYFGWASIYAAEQGFVPALGLFLPDGMREYSLAVLRSEQDAILMANRSTDFINRLFAVIISAVVLLGLTVIFSTFSSSIERKSAEIAVVQAIGASSRKIAQIFSFETLIIFGCSVLLALAIDITIIEWILDHPDFKKIIFPKNIEYSIIQAALENLNFWKGRLMIILSGALLAVSTTVLTVILFLRRPIAEAVREK